MMREALVRTARPERRCPMKRNSRLARALGLDGNPLRRGADWLGTAIVLALSAIFLIGGPLLGGLGRPVTPPARPAERHDHTAWPAGGAVAPRTVPPAPAFVP